METDGRPNTASPEEPGDKEGHDECMQRCMMEDMECDKKCDEETLLYLYCVGRCTSVKYMCDARCPPFWEKLDKYKYPQSLPW